MPPFEPITVRTSETPLRLGTQNSIGYEPLVTLEQRADALRNTDTWHLD